VTDLYNEFWWGWRQLNQISNHMFYLYFIFIQLKFTQFQPFSFQTIWRMGHVKLTLLLVHTCKTPQNFQALFPTQLKAGIAITVSSYIIQSLLIKSCCFKKINLIKRYTLLKFSFNVLINIFNKGACSRLCG